jgi:hypothetical protein
MTLTWISRGGSGCRLISPCDEYIIDRSRSGRCVYFGVPSSIA